jgi:hypothetical protein
MTVEAKMYAIMSTAAGITALVPAARIKPPGAWQNLTRPYLVHFPVAVDLIHTHYGLAELRMWRFYQIDIFADTYGNAIEIRDALVLALDGYKDAEVNRIAYQGAGGAGDFDTDLGIQHLALNFEVTGGMTG